MSRGAKAPKWSRRYIPKPAEGLRLPSATLLRADLELVEVTALRAAVELRGFASHDLADQLCDIIEQVRAVHGAVAIRLRQADVVSGG